MQKNSQDFSMQEAMRLANSPAGQQLLELLKHSDAEKMQQAASQAAAGDYANAAQTLSALLASPEAQALMKQLGGK